MTATSGAATGRTVFAHQTSFQFHAGLERPGVFLAREWRTIVIAGGGFVALMLAILFSVDTAFFYPRIETDQLRYLLKASTFVETGTTAAREAVNGRVFIYAATPGLLRAPFLFLFDEFDSQLRAIQVMNVVTVALSALMAAYILSWALPEKAHKWAITFAFAFVLLSPDWVTNILVPLADAPYTALTFGGVILAALTFTSKKPLGSNKLALASFLALVTVAFFVRYTALILIVYAALLLWQRWSGRRVPLKTILGAAGIAAAMLVVLLAVSASNLFSRYLWEPLDFLIEAKKIPVALHLFASALPAQVVPVFNLGFEVPPLTSRRAPVFASTPRDLIWMLVGLGISALVVRGMIDTRRRLLPEIVYLLVPLPLLAILTPSTTRYLMAYQPFIWMFFISGLATVASPAMQRLSPRAIRTAAAVLGLAMIATVVAMRSAQTAKTAGSDSPTAMIEGARTYTRDVADTFRRLRLFLESLPREESLLVEARGNVGRFKLISDRNYYNPDSLLPLIAREKKVYSVLACGSAVHCAEFSEWIRRQKKWIDGYGSFEYETVFEHTTPSAHALVQQLVPRPEGYSASGLTAR